MPPPLQQTTADQTTQVGCDELQTESDELQDEAPSRARFLFSDELGWPAQPPPSSDERRTTSRNTARRPDGRPNKAERPDEQQPTGVPRQPNKAPRTPDESDGSPADF